MAVSLWRGFKSDQGLFILAASTFCFSKEVKVQQNTALYHTFTWQIFTFTICEGVAVVPAAELKEKKCKKNWMRQSCDPSNAINLNDNKAEQDTRHMMCQRDNRSAYFNLK